MLASELVRIAKDMLGNSLIDSVLAKMHDVSDVEKYIGIRSEPHKENERLNMCGIYDSRLGLNAPTIVSFPVYARDTSAKQLRSAKYQFQDWITGFRSKL
jgi:hypothetical protein